MYNNCLFWAIGMWLRNPGTYLCFRKTKKNKYRWIVWWHVLWMDRDFSVYSFVPLGNYKNRIFPPLIYYGTVKEGDV